MLQYDYVTKQSYTQKVCLPDLRYYDGCLFYISKITYYVLGTHWNLLITLFPRVPYKTLFMEKRAPSKKFLKNVSYNASDYSGCTVLYYTYINYIIYLEWHKDDTGSS